MPAPSTRCVVLSNKSFVNPSERPSVSERALAAHGNVPFSYATPRAFASSSVRPDPRDFGIRVRDRGNDARVEEALLPRRDFGRDLAFVARLVREHRLADDVADREDVRHVRAHLLVDRDEAALVHLDAGALRGDPPRRSALRPTATSTRS